ncbi:hypothetical protein L9G15_26435, partial [Shewanella sp. A3A]|nr:hypothetical protein [Shewanella ferrihydritica]
WMNWIAGLAAIITTCIDGRLRWRDAGFVRRHCRETPPNDECRLWLGPPDEPAGHRRGCARAEIGEATARAFITAAILLPF